MSIPKQHDDLIECLTSYFDSDDDNNSIYTCSECGHYNKHILNNDVFPTYLVGLLYYYPFFNKSYSDYIKIHLYYSTDFSKIEKIHLQYDYNIDGVNHDLCVPRENEIYYAETEKDIEMYKSSTLYNFYYRNGDITKKININVENYMGWNIWGGGIYTYDNDKKYFVDDDDSAKEWSYYDIGYSINKSI